MIQEEIFGFQFVTKDYINLTQKPINYTTFLLNHLKQKLSSNRVFRKGLVEDPNKNGLWISCNEALNFLDYSSQKIYNKSFNPKKADVFNLTNISALTTNENNLVFTDNHNQEIVWYNTRLQKMLEHLV